MPGSKKTNQAKAPLLAREYRQPDYLDVNTDSSGSLTDSPFHTPSPPSSPHGYNDTNSETPSPLAQAELNSGDEQLDNVPYNYTGKWTKRSFASAFREFQKKHQKDSADSSSSFKRTPEGFLPDFFLSAKPSTEDSLQNDYTNYVIKGYSQNLQNIQVQKKTFKGLLIEIALLMPEMLLIITALANTAFQYFVKQGIYSNLLTAIFHVFAMQEVAITVVIICSSLVFLKLLWNMSRSPGHSHLMNTYAPMSRLDAIMYRRVSSQNNMGNKLELELELISFKSLSFAKMLKFADILLEDLGPAAQRLLLDKDPSRRGLWNSASGFPIDSEKERHQILEFLRKISYLQKIRSRRSTKFLKGDGSTPEDFIEALASAYDYTHLIMPILKRPVASKTTATGFATDLLGFLVALGLVTFFILLLTNQGGIFTTLLSAITKKYGALPEVYTAIFSVFTAISVTVLIFSVLAFRKTIQRFTHESFSIGSYEQYEKRHVEEANHHHARIRILLGLFVYKPNHNNQSGHLTHGVAAQHFLQLILAGSTWIIFSIAFTTSGMPWYGTALFALPLAYHTIRGLMSASAITSGKNLKNTRWADGIAGVSTGLAAAAILFIASPSIAILGYLLLIPTVGSFTLSLHDLIRTSHWHLNFKEIEWEQVAAYLGITLISIAAHLFMKTPIAAWSLVSFPIIPTILILTGTVLVTFRLIQLSLRSHIQSPEKELGSEKPGLSFRLAQWIMPNAGPRPDAGRQKRYLLYVTIIALLTVFFFALSGPTGFPVEGTQLFLAYASMLLTGLIFYVRNIHKKTQNTEFQNAHDEQTLRQSNHLLQKTSPYLQPRPGNQSPSPRSTAQNPRNEENDENKYDGQESGSNTGSANSQRTASLRSESQSDSQGHNADENNSPHNFSANGSPLNTNGNNGLTGTAHPDPKANARGAPNIGGDNEDSVTSSFSSPSSDDDASDFFGGSAAAGTTSFLPLNGGHEESSQAVGPKREGKHANKPPQKGNGKPTVDQQSSSFSSSSSSSNKKHKESETEDHELGLKDRKEQGENEHNNSESSSHSSLDTEEEDKSDKSLSVSGGNTELQQENSLPGSTTKSQNSRKMSGISSDYRSNDGDDSEEENEDPGDQSDDEKHSSPKEKPNEIHIDKDGWFSPEELKYFEGVSFAKALGALSFLRVRELHSSLNSDSSKEMTDTVSVNFDVSGYSIQPDDEGRRKITISLGQIDTESPTFCFNSAPKTPIKAFAETAQKKSAFTRIAASLSEIDLLNPEQEFYFATEEGEDGKVRFATKTSSDSKFVVIALGDKSQVEQVQINAKPWVQAFDSVDGSEHDFSEMDLAGLNLGQTLQALSNFHITEAHLILNSDIDVMAESIISTELGDEANWVEILTREDAEGTYKHALIHLDRIPAASFNEDSDVAASEESDLSESFRHISDVLLKLNLSAPFYLFFNKNEAQPENGSESELDEGDDDENEQDNSANENLSESGQADDKDEPLFIAVKFGHDGKVVSVRYADEGQTENGSDEGDDDINENKHDSNEHQLLFEDEQSHEELEIGLDEGRSNEHGSTTGASSANSNHDSNNPESTTTKSASADDYLNLTEEQLSTLLRKIPATTVNLKLQRVISDTILHGKEKSSAHDDDSYPHDGFISLELGANGQYVLADTAEDGFSDLFHKHIARLSFSNDPTSENSSDPTDSQSQLRRATAFSVVHVVPGLALKFPTQIYLPVYWDADKEAWEVSNEETATNFLPFILQNGCFVPRDRIVLDATSSPQNSSFSVIHFRQSEVHNQASSLNQENAEKNGEESSKADEKNSASDDLVGGPHAPDWIKKIRMDTIKNALYKIIPVLKTYADGNAAMDAAIAQHVPKSMGPSKKPRRSSLAGIFDRPIFSNDDVAIVAAVLASYDGWKSKKTDWENALTQSDTLLTSEDDDLAKDYWLKRDPKLSECNEQDLATLKNGWDKKFSGFTQNLIALDDLSYEHITLAAQKIHANGLTLPVKDHSRAARIARAVFEEIAAKKIAREAAIAAQKQPSAATASPNALSVLQPSQQPSFFVNGPANGRQEIGHAAFAAQHGLVSSNGGMQSSSSSHHADASSDHSDLQINGSAEHTKNVPAKSVVSDKKEEDQQKPSSILDILRSSSVLSNIAVEQATPLSNPQQQDLQLEVKDDSPRPPIPDKPTLEKLAQELSGYNISTVLAIEDLGEDIKRQNSPKRPRVICTLAIPVIQIEGQWVIPESPEELAGKPAAFFYVQKGEPSKSLQISATKKVSPLFSYGEDCQLTQYFKESVTKFHAFCKQATQKFSNGVPNKVDEKVLKSLPISLKSFRDSAERAELYSKNNQTKAQFDGIKATLSQIIRSLLITHRTIESLGNEPAMLPPQITQDDVAIATAVITCRVLEQNYWSLMGYWENDKLAELSALATSIEGISREIATLQEEGNKDAGAWEALAKKLDKMCSRVVTYGNAKAALTLAKKEGITANFSPIDFRDSSHNNMQNICRDYYSELCPPSLVSADEAQAGRVGGDGEQRDPSVAALNSGSSSPSLFSTPGPSSNLAPPVMPPTNLNGSSPFSPEG
ncbi:MAG: hypothetical protein K0Q74_890 [Gammaproteobacteria bacterium]|nr:hypothetical protein [Gammaproteobacteria bacterium]